jgi:hypothetical protein
LNPCDANAAPQSAAPVKSSATIRISSNTLPDPPNSGSLPPGQFHPVNRCGGKMPIIHS